LLITFATFCYFLSIGALIPTVPLYVEGPLGGSDFSVGLVVGAFAFSAVLLRPFIGGLGDRRGRRILMVAGALIVGGSTALYGFASSIPALILLRIALGAGEAAFYVGAASAINDLAPDERRGEALSFFSLALYSGIALGTVTGETVLQASHFGAVWTVSALSALVAALLALRVRETRPEGLEQPSRRRLIHPSGLKPGTILATSVWGLAGFNTFVPLYALQIGMSGSRSVFFTFSAIVLSIRLFGARLPDMLGPRRAASAALITNSLGLVVAGAWPSQVGLFAGTFLFGIGQALAFPALMTLALSGTRASERGSVVGTFTAFFDLAFGLGAFSLGIVASITGYRGAFFFAAFVSLAGFALLQTYAHRAKVARSAEEARHPEPL
jgi:MFS family permease